MSKPVVGSTHAFSIEHHQTDPNLIDSDTYCIYITRQAIGLGRSHRAMAAGPSQQPPPQEQQEEEEPIIAVPATAAAGVDGRPPRPNGEEADDDEKEEDDEEGACLCLVYACIPLCTDLDLIDPPYMYSHLPPQQARRSRGASSSTTPTGP
jgi:hypothetical protein